MSVDPMKSSRPRVRLKTEGKGSRRVWSQRHKSQRHKSRGNRSHEDNSYVDGIWPDAACSAASWAFFAL